MCTIEDYKILNLSKDFGWYKLSTELKEWHSVYLTDKETILDIGAGEGETALFYVLHGAKKVICIEGDKKNYARLVKNAKIIEKKYNAQIITINAMLGNIKIDIEGGEERMILEQHFAGYWEEVAHSKGIPPATKIYRLTKAKYRNKILRSKEQFFLNLLSNPGKGK
ncbi:MAG: hypothetical protein KGH64_06555 [Candidatus Micrarchaeota archaeon]|nr:hypothetical protein [Candidatus Micrarchaeota archaeon]